MEDHVGLPGLEPEPARALARACFVDQPDLAACAPAHDPAADLVADQGPPDPLLDPFGFLRVEAVVDERLEILPHRLRELAVGNAGDLRALDDVAGVDVRILIGFARAADHENDADHAVRIHEGARGRDVPRPFGLDAGREFGERLLFQGCADERLDRLAEAGAEPSPVEAGDVNRRDRGAVGHDGPLRGRRLGRHDDEREEQAKCSHARGMSK